MQARHRTICHNNRMEDTSCCAKNSNIILIMASFNNNSFNSSNNSGENKDGDSFDQDDRGHMQREWDEDISMACRGGGVKIR